MAEETISLRFDGYWSEPNWSDIPTSAGIYCIYAGTWNQYTGTGTVRQLLYIGKSKNVRRRVPADPQTRKDLWTKCLRSNEVLRASFAPINLDRDRAEAAMINHHKPLFNSLDYDDTFPFDKTHVELQGKTAWLTPSFTVDPSL